MWSFCEQTNFFLNKRKKNTINELDCLKTLTNNLNQRAILLYVTEWFNWTIVQLENEQYGWKMMDILKPNNERDC